MANSSVTDMLIRDEAEPAIIRLWRALGRLRSTITFMNTGAHPDDEHSGLLAWLRYGQGMRVVIACSTRGEGGQNALGPERGDALGLIRTAEMEAAAKVLDAHVAWLGFGTDDPVHDFGFSKDGDDTLRRWQGDLVIRRLAGAYRAMRPDIVLPTFLDVPGQHGHHRAMTRAAQQAISLARDPNAALGDVHGGDLPAWDVAKLYLPGWSGGGGTYDDETPPPPTTVTVTAEPTEPVFGVPYDRIGEWSRRRHASQGMGIWRDPPQREWPLHRVDERVEDDITDGLPADLHQLAEMTDLQGLKEAALAIDDAIAAFPDRNLIVASLLAAASGLRAARAAMAPDIAHAHGHRLSNKLLEVDIAIAEAAGLHCQLSVPSRYGRAGQQIAAELRVNSDSGTRVLQVAYRTPPGVSVKESQVLISADAAPSPNFGATWSPFGDNASLAAEVRAELNGHDLQIVVPAVPDLRILPAATAEISPTDVLLTTHRRTAEVTIRPEVLSLAPAEGLTIESANDGYVLSWQKSAGPFRHSLPLLEPDGNQTFTTQSVKLPGNVQDQLLKRATLEVLAVDTSAPAGRIGVIVGTDRSADWLERLGAEVDLIDQPDPDCLAQYDCVVLGVMAMARGDIAPGVLRDYVENGGNLVSFYQRPDRGWHASESGPRFLRLGTPSLRWRVTDPDAIPEILAPDHVLLNWPNRIGAGDWQGWVKDRGLYFAAEWDRAYQPLLALSDRGEAPLQGALISATIGKGRHTYCALSLAQQMDALVPGAFRLFVNIVSPIQRDAGRSSTQ